MLDDLAVAALDLQTEADDGRLVVADQGTLGIGDLERVGPVRQGVDAGPARAPTALGRVLAVEALDLLADVFHLWFLGVRFLAVGLGVRTTRKMRAVSESSRRPVPDQHGGHPVDDDDVALGVWHLVERHRLAGRSARPENVRPTGAALVVCEAVEHVTSSRRAFAARRRGVLLRPAARPALRRPPAWPARR